MELTEKQYLRIDKLLPLHRGNVKITNFILLSALIYPLENGCKRRALPNSFGKWHTIYVRLDRWPQNGVLERVYQHLSGKEYAAVEYTLLIQHQSRHILTHTEREKNGKQAIGKSRGWWNTKIHTITVGERLAMGFQLSAGNVADAPLGRLLLERVGPLDKTVSLLKDRAYEDDKIRLCAFGLRFNPEVPAKKNRVRPREYDKVL